MANPGDKKSAKPSDNKWAVMGGIALNVEYTRKYGFDATGAAKVNAKLVAVPPPSLFQEAVQADIAGRAKRAAGLESSEHTPLPRPEPNPEPDRNEPAKNQAADNELRDWELEEEIGGTEETEEVEQDNIDDELEEEIGDWEGEGIDDWEHKETKDREDNQEQEDVFFDDREIEERHGDKEKKDDDEFSTLSLVIKDQPTAAYTLDDGVTTPSEGITAEDGTLVHRIAVASTKCVITFKESSTRLEFPVQHDESEGTIATSVRDDQGLTVDENLETDDDWPVLSLQVEDKPNSAYTLDDGVNPPSSGTTSEDGMLNHPVSPEAETCSIRFGDDYMIQFPVDTGH